MKPAMADPIIDRSPAQKLVRVNALRVELFGYGYSVVTTEWLHSVLDNVRPVALMEAAE